MIFIALAWISLLIQFHQFVKSKIFAHFVLTQSIAAQYIKYILRTRFIPMDRDTPMLLAPDLRDWLPRFGNPLVARVLNHPPL